VVWCQLSHARSAATQFTALSDTTGLLAMATRNERLRQVMQMLLLRGSCMLEHAERRTIAESLLSECIARISSKISDKIEVSLVCPARHRLCAAC